MGYGLLGGARSTRPSRRAGAHHGQQRTEFICVDPKFERHPWGGTDNQDHSLLYSVEIECGNPLLCGSPGYTQNHEVTCSICTKPLLIEGET